MQRILISETPGHIGETVKLCGWIDVRRDHGKLVFLDLRDVSGKIQMVALPSHPEAHAAAQVKNVSEQVGGFPALGHIAVQVHLCVALKQAAEY